MSKIYHYECDGGALLIGNRGVQCSYPNNWGDGEWEVEVRNKKEEFKYNDHDKYTFSGSVRGDAIKVYSYDCPDTNDLKDPNFVLCTLKGRYAVFAEKGSGNMMLQQWN